MASALVPTVCTRRSTQNDCHTRTSSRVLGQSTHNATYVRKKWNVFWAEESFHAAEALKQKYTCAENMVMSVNTKCFLHLLNEPHYIVARIGVEPHTSTRQSRHTPKKKSGWINSIREKWLTFPQFRWKIPVFDKYFSVSSLILHPR